MKTFFSKFIALFSSKYDVPEDHTWSKQTMAAQSIVQEDALAAVIEDSKDFIETKGYNVDRFNGNPAS